jgi:hypothetical protein
MTLKHTMRLVVLVTVASSAAYAAAIDVTYTVSGSPGAWDLTFTVSNNLTNWPTQDVYQFGVQLSRPGVIGSPAGYDGTITGSWTNLFIGGGPYLYNNVWDDYNDFNHLLPGNRVSGFIVGITDPAPPLSVRWFAFTVPDTFDSNDIYTGTGAFNIDPVSLTAGFEGGGSADVTASPEPSNIVTLLIGSLAVVFGCCKRQHPAD